MEEQELDDSCKETIRFYKEHPAEFVEECFGVKLAPYQKIAFEKLASQSQMEFICWNRVNKKYSYALTEIIRALLFS